MERRRREGSHEMIPRREPRQQKSTKRTGHKVVFILVTVLLVGICTVAMLAGLFMMYVRTTLAPTLEVNADDYTMNLSSIIYYQDRDTGDWVEYQTVYGTENRIWVDYEQIPDALWQAAVAIEDHRFFEHNGVDAIVDATGSASVLPDCFQLLKKGGRLLQFSSTKDDEDISINPAYFYRNELQYYTSYCQVHQFGRAVDAMDTGKVKTDRLITRLYPLEEFPQAIEDVLDHNVLKLVIRPNGMED